MEAGYGPVARGSRSRPLPAPRRPTPRDAPERLYKGVEGRASGGLLPQDASARFPAYGRSGHGQRRSDRTSGNEGHRSQDPLGLGSLPHSEPDCSARGGVAADGHVFGHLQGIPTRNSIEDQGGIRSAFWFDRPWVLWYSSMPEHSDNRTASPHRLLPLSPIGCKHAR